MFKNLLTKCALFDRGNHALFLRLTAALSFSMGSVGLITGLVINDKIPKKEKTFMIIQEALEGMIDLVVFIFLATGFAKFGKKLILNGKVTPSIEIAKDKLGKALYLSKDKVKQAINIYKTDPLSLSDKLYAPIHKFVTSGEVFSDLFGTILAFNIATPVIRNHYASKLSKIFNTKKDKTNSISPILPSVKLNPNVRFNNQDPFKAFESNMNAGKSLNRMVSFTSGSMRL